MRNHYHHSTIYLFLVEHYSCYTGGLVSTACACMIILRKPENPLRYYNPHPENLRIHLRLETPDIFLYHQKMKPLPVKLPSTL